MSEPRPAPNKDWVEMESTRRGGYTPRPIITPYPNPDGVNGWVHDPNRYASNDLDAYEPPNCERCGQPARNDFYEDTSFGEPVAMYKPNRHWCETPNCVDSRGYNVVNGTGKRRE